MRMRFICYESWARIEALVAEGLRRHRMFLGYGYNRAARIVDVLQAQGLVRPGDGCRYVPV